MIYNFLLDDENCLRKNKLKKVLQIVQDTYFSIYIMYVPPINLLKQNIIKSDKNAYIQVVTKISKKKKKMHIYVFRRNKFCDQFSLLIYLYCFEHEIYSA